MKEEKWIEEVLLPNFHKLEEENKKLNNIIDILEEWLKVYEDEANIKSVINKLRELKGGK